MSENKKNTFNECEKTRILEETGVIDFKNRLTIVLEGLSGNAFSKKVGMSEAVIRDYLSGKTYPALNRLAIIAKKCDIPIEWLATGNGVCRLLDSHELDKTINIPVFDIHLDELGKKIKSLGVPPVKTLPFDASWLNSQGLNLEDLVIVWSKGDSMEPTISNYDALVVNQSNKELFDGYIYIVRYDGYISTKRVQNQGPYLALLCDNNKYPDIRIEKNNMENFEIIGHVVFIIKALN